MAIAVPLGLILGAAGGWLAVLAGVVEQNPLLGFIVFASCLTLPGVLLAFVLVVDRKTLEGATETPNDSIESGWYDKATSGSFTDLLLILGVASAILSFIPADFPVDLKLVLPAVLAAGALSFGIRYLVLRWKG